MQMVRIAPIVLLLLIAAHLGAQQLRFDRNWWDQANDQERWGFTLGYFDCRQIENALHGNADHFTRFINGNLVSRPQSVAKALEASAHDMADRPDDIHAERWPEKHGDLNGGWWGSTKIGDEDAKLGYVEGYAACASPRLSKERLRAASNAVDRFYDFPAHEKKPIAEVLKPFLLRR